MNIARHHDRSAWILTGLLGRGIGKSRTPRMHEQEAKAQGLLMAYLLFDFTELGWADDTLPRILDAAELVGFAGFNVTIPFKQAIIPYLDELSEPAERVGAVNTVSLTKGRWVGHNTDVTGFARNMCKKLPEIAGDCVLQIGCGGGGSATAYAMLGELGLAELLLYDSETAKADALCGQLNAVFGEGKARVADSLERAAAAADGIVNASPMGMEKYPGSPIDADLLEARHWVAEIVYFPLETELLRDARALGCRTLDGSGMAINQAADAFEIFTGHEASRPRMEKSFFDLETIAGAKRA